MLVQFRFWTSRLSILPPAICVIIGNTLLGCQDHSPIPLGSNQTSDLPFRRGADLSYVNEMLDCGGEYRNRAGIPTNPYEIFASEGADLIRVRLWHTPDWTSYSDLADVSRTIQEAQSRGMEILLDFHYSDEWADPGKQQLPAAWIAIGQDDEQLGDSLYHYTSFVLRHLHSKGALPEMVQIGNEINAEILQLPGQDYPHINWERNSYLLQQGLKAVREISEELGIEIESMLHIAQPEHALWWFAEAQQHGLHDFDWIGLSYYPKWSEYSLSNLGEAIDSLGKTYQKQVMVVETAYPFTLENQDGANNLLGEDALIPGFPATEASQLAYLQSLEASILAGGGQGLIYWEPAWISTPCSTRWGQGSHWDNATLFRADGSPALGMQYFGTE